MGYYEEQKRINITLRNILIALKEKKIERWSITDAWIAGMTEDFAIPEKYILKRFDLLKETFDYTIKDKTLYFNYPVENKENISNSDAEDEADAVLKNAMVDDE